MDGDDENCDVSSGYGSTNIHIVYLNNVSKLLINSNDRDDMDMNANLKNEDVISGIGLINIHTTPQFKESSNLNEINMGVINVDVNGGHFYMNSPTVSIKNHISIDSAEKKYDIASNRYQMENIGSHDGVDIDIALPESIFHQYEKIE